MKEKSYKDYERTKREVAHEIAEIIKKRNLSVAIADDFLDAARLHIHRTAHL